MRLLAIDPGNIESAFCIVELPCMTILDKGKISNEEMLKIVTEGNYDNIAIEMIACYGMPVGREVFDTCIWIGRFTEEAVKYCRVDYVYRKEEKLLLCGSLKAKDSNIRQALIDRYAQFDFKNGKGTKKNPDFFYGFKADVWASFAVACVWEDKNNG